MTTGSVPELNDITGLILAGGRASRMHHLDKGLQRLDGLCLIEHVIARLSPQVGPLAINANRHLADYARYGYPVWPDHGFNAMADDEQNFKGPLAGVESGLMHCTTPFLLVVPCDSPYLPIDLAQRLMRALLHADIAVACSGNPASPRLQPVFCLIRATMLSQLQHYLQSGARRMDGWYGAASVVQVYFDDDAAFRNINTLDELQTCSAQSGKK